MTGLSGLTGELAVVAPWGTGAPAAVVEVAAAVEAKDAEEWQVETVPEG